jgi:Zn-dependent protease with chaperone function
VILVLAAAVVAAIALPHVLHLERVPPLTAAALWGTALGLRALTGVFMAIYLVFYLPATDLFTALTHWCWHAILPVATTHLGVNGHRVGDAIAVLPGVLLAASVFSIAVGVYRAARSVSRLIRRGRLGEGPGDSVIIGGPDVVLAAAGISRPRVVVSAGALLALDDAELAAGIAHERGHIARHHRFVTLYAELCRALGRFLPGTAAASRQLAFHLERDADAWALARRSDRYALASAICKAAVSQRVSPAISSLGGGEVRARVDELVDPPKFITGWRGRALNLAAVVGAVLLVALVAAVPATLAAGPAAASARHLPLC